MLIGWIKKNKLLTIVLLIAAYLLLKSFFGISVLNLNLPSEGGVVKISDKQGFGTTPTGLLPPPSSKPIYEQAGYTPQPDIQNRLVIQESTLSLLVKDVVESRNKIVKYAQDLGGYMVSSNISNPQDAPNATVSVREFRPQDLKKHSTSSEA